ncbi:MAG: glycosylase [Chryseolinea sp.]
MKGLLASMALCLIIFACGTKSETSTADTKSSGSSAITGEMLNFTAYESNPVFSGTATDTWDKNIRERGFILFEDGIFNMWYTGYRDGDSEVMHLGYATSSDGINWKRYEKNPIVGTDWVEDVNVVKDKDTYYMFAEGKGDIAHLLISKDKVTWTEQGNLDIRQVNGQPISLGPYGTPTAWLEDGSWYLLYERGDLGVWLAKSSDLKVFTNVQDEPVLVPGPELYDQFGIAVNQVVKNDGKYYAYYHATAFKDWSEWSSCVAISEDRIHWKKYDQNPIQVENKSSPILVNDGKQNRLYTMHPAVAVHFPTVRQ